MADQNFEASCCKDIVKYFGFDFSYEEISIQRKDGSYFTSQEYATDLLIQKHLNHQLTLCLKRYPYTKIFCIDIDFKESQHELIDRVKSTVSILGKPVFIERSIKEDGGYHLYYKFKKSVQTMLKYWSNLPSFLIKNKGIKLEAICNNNKLKLPFSEYYRIYGYYDENSEDLILQQSFKQCVENIKNAEEADFPEVFKEIKQTLVDNKKVIMPEKIITQKEINWSKFSYGAGSRWINQNRIAWTATRYDIPEWEFYRLCESLDCGSKDMAEWRKHGSVEKNLKKMYEYYEHKNRDHVIKRLNLKERSDKNNRKLILDNATDYSRGILECDKKNLEELISHFYVGRKGKCKQRFIDDVIKLYSFLLIKKKNLSNNYIKSSYFLNDGVFLDRPLLLLIGKELDISNPDVIYKFLKDHKIIKAIKNKETGWTYCYARDKVHYCQHFIVESVHSLIKFFKTKIENILLMVFEKRTIINIAEKIFRKRYFYILEET